jgi:hypothetical protein
VEDGRRADAVDVDPEDIVGFVAKQKMTKEERLEAKREGREGIVKKWAMRNLSGTTNREKLKNKPFLMVRDSKRVRKKKNLTFGEQQKRGQNHIKNLKRDAKRNLKSMRR